MPCPAAQRGYILLESLIAIVLIAVVFWLMIDGLHNIFGSQLKSEYRIEATHYAIEALEIVYNANANYGYQGFVHLLNGENQVSDASELDMHCKTAPVVLYVALEDYDPTSSNSFYLARDALSDTIEPFYNREITLQYACRDNVDGHLVDSQDAEAQDVTDSGMIQVTTRVDWQAEGGQNQVQLVSYVTEMEKK